MEKRKIGPLEVTVVGLGSNTFGTGLDEASATKVVHAALDAGINFFDTSDNYGNAHSEEILGRALKGRRREAVIATKFGTKMSATRSGGAHPDYIRLAVEDSLKRLGVDCIDLYQMHRPDPKVPIADTLGALHELVQAGKVRAVGCSSFSPTQLREAADAARGRTPFASVQNEYSVLEREPEQGVLEACEKLGVMFIPFSPLAKGMLTGKYRQGQPAPKGSRLENRERYAQFTSDRAYAVAEALLQYAEQRGHTLLELAFSWLLSHRVLASVIAGASKPEQVKGNVKAAQWRMTDAELADIDAIAKA
jgi:aryl-alcohol dehydrogenase-like predicted oxidoreductase